MRLRTRPLLALVLVGAATSFFILGLMVGLPPEVALPIIVVMTVAAVGLLARVVMRRVRSALTEQDFQERSLVLLGTVIATLMAFSTAYLAISRAEPGAFTQELDFGAAMYFATTVLGTVGFGDIAAVSGPARFVVCLQMAFDLVVFTSVVSLLVSARPPAPAPVPED